MEPAHALTDAPLPAPVQNTRFYSGGTWHDASIFLRKQLSPGHKVNGPAIIIEPHQTVVVEDGWGATITAKNHLVVERIVEDESAGGRRRHRGRRCESRGRRARNSPTPIVGADPAGHASPLQDRVHWTRPLAALSPFHRIDNSAPYARPFGA